MKVLIATNSSLPDCFGGAEQHLHRLAPVLRNQFGVELDVYSMFYNEANQRKAVVSFEGVPVRVMPRPVAVSPVETYANHYFSMYETARSILSSQKPDLVHLDNTYNVLSWALAAWSLGIPVSAAHMDFQYGCQNLKLLYRNQFLCDGDSLRCSSCNKDWDHWARERRILLDKLREHLFGFHIRRSNFHICMSSPAKNLLVRRGADPDRILRLQHGLPDEWVPPTQKPKRDRLVFGFIGRFNWIKGIDVIVDAFLRGGINAELHVFGETEIWNSDNYANEQKKKARGSEKIVFRGRFGPDDLESVHRDIDVLLTPSVWVENNPYSIAEAHFYGTPVLASDIPGVRDIVVHYKNGWLIPRGSVFEWNRSIKDLVNDPSMVYYANSLLVARDPDAVTFHSIGEDARQYRKWWERSVSEGPQASAKDVDLLLSEFRSCLSF